MVHQKPSRREITSLFAILLLALALVLIPQHAYAEETAGGDTGIESVQDEGDSQDETDIDEVQGEGDEGDQDVDSDLPASDTPVPTNEGDDVQDDTPAADTPAKSAVEDDADDAPMTLSTAPAADDADEDANTTAGSAPAQAPADSYDGQTFVISSGLNQQKTIEAKKTTTGSDVQINQYANKTNQKWTFVKTKVVKNSLTYYQIILDGTKQAMAVKGGTDNGWNVQLASKLNITGTTPTEAQMRQLWTLKKEGAGFNIVSYLTAADGSVLVLDVNKGKSDNGTTVGVYKESDSYPANQRFYLYNVAPKVEGGKTIADGAYAITMKANSKRADVRGKSTANNASIISYAKGSGQNQKFYFEYDGEGFYTITSLISGKKVAITSWGGAPSKKGNVVPGLNVIQSTASGSGAQKWAVKRNSNGTYTLTNKASGLIFALDGSNIALNRPTGSEWQQVTFTKVDILTPGIYEIHSRKNTGKVLDIQKNSPSSSTKVELFTDNDGLSQRFQLVRVGGVGSNKYRIRTASSGGWLTENGTANKSKVIQKGNSKTAANNANTWEIVVNGDWYSLKNLQSGKVLDARGGKTANGTQMQVYQANGTSAQHFNFQRAQLVDDGYYTIQSELGKYLDIQGAAYKGGANAVTYQKNGQMNQSFYISYSDGTYRIRNINSGKMIDTNSKGNVKQYSSNSNNSQKWNIEIGDGGYLVFTNKASGKVLNVSNGSKANSANVNTASGNGKAQQNWKLRKTEVYGWTRNENSWTFHYKDGTFKEFTNAAHAAWVKIRGKSSGTQYLAVIDNHNFRTVFFQGKKNNWVPVQDFICSVGTTHPEDPTFGITFRGETVTNGKRGYRMGWVPYEYYWVEFFDRVVDEHGEGQRFHSILYWGKAGGREFDGRLGGAQTHGCVRLSLEDSKWIYDRIKKGTKVVSY